MGASSGIKILYATVPLSNAVVAIQALRNRTCIDILSEWLPHKQTKTKSIYTAPVDEEESDPNAVKVPNLAKETISENSTYTGNLF